MLKRFSGLVVAAALAVPSAASAVAPNGEYLFEGSGANAIYVVTKDADLSVFGFGLLCGKRKFNEKGKYKGKCNGAFPGIGDDDGKVKGKLVRKDGATVLTETAKFRGKSRNNGTTVEFDIDWSFRISLPDGSDMATYKWNVKACAEARGQRQCSKEKDSQLVPALAFANVAVLTDWTLCLDVTTNDDNKIKGTAKIETESGQEIDLKVKGEYVPGDASTMKLKNKKGSNVKITDANMDGDDLVGLIGTSFFGNKQSFLATGTPKTQ